MSQSRLPALAFLLALAGCGEGAPPANQAQAIRMANPGSDRLKALTPLNQRIGLRRAIRAEGKRCANVTRLAFQEEYQNLAMWVAQCSDGRHWAVFIAPNEDVQVRDCTENAQLDLPVCHPLPPLPRDPNAPPGTEPNENSAATNAAR